MLALLHKQVSSGPPFVPGAAKWMPQHLDRQLQRRYPVNQLQKAFSAMLSFFSFGQTNQ